MNLGRSGFSFPSLPRVVVFYLRCLRKLEITVIGYIYVLRIRMTSVEFRNTNVFRQHPETNICPRSKLGKERLPQLHFKEPIFQKKPCLVSKSTCKPNTRPQAPTPISNAYRLNERTRARKHRKEKSILNVDRKQGHNAFTMKTFGSNVR